MDSILVECTEIGKNFGLFKALQKISFSIEKPIIFGILGKNGAGKSTLIKILAGLIRPTYGELKFGEKSFKNDDIDIKKRIGLQLSNPILYEDLTIRENLHFFAQMGRNFNRSNTNKKIEEYAKLFNMSRWIDSPIRILSTGMQKKVDLMRIFINENDILLLDEPFAGLDIKAIQKLLSHIKKIQRENNKLMILSTHKIELVKDTCDRVIILKKGTITEDFDKKDIDRIDIEDYF
jgi:ABC-2 type transport system ATP-binding protein